MIHLSLRTLLGQSIGRSEHQAEKRRRKKIRTPLSSLGFLWSSPPSYSERQQTLNDLILSLVYFQPAILYELYLGLFQKGPAFPIPAMVATISRAYSRLLETQFRSIRLRKYGPEKSFTRSRRGMIPSVVAGSNLAQFRTCSSDRKRFMVLQALGAS